MEKEKLSIRQRSFIKFPVCKCKVHTPTTSMGSLHSLSFPLIATFHFILGGRRYVSEWSNEAIVSKLLHILFFPLSCIFHHSNPIIFYASYAHITHFLPFSLSLSLSLAVLFSFLCFLFFCTIQISLAYAHHTHLSIIQRLYDRSISSTFSSFVRGMSAYTHRID